MSDKNKIVQQIRELVMGMYPDAQTVTITINPTETKFEIRYPPKFPPVVYSSWRAE